MAASGRAGRCYVLIGHGMAYEDTLYSARADVEVIRARPGQSLQEAARQIQGPADLVALAHCTQDGLLQWEEHQPLVPLAQLMQALPRSGMRALTLHSCYGGLAVTQACLQAAPPGMLVQTMAGPRHQASGRVMHDFIAETVEEHRPVSLLLKFYDNFDPVEYGRYIAHWNKLRGTTHDGDPEQALPFMLGIGGAAPVQVDLAREMRNLSSRPMDAKGRAAWARAVGRVQAAFDTQHYVMHPQGSGLDGQFMVQDLGAAGEQALDARISRLADALTAGHPVAGDSPAARADTLRIGYALTAAYLEESGMLAAWQARARAGTVPLPATQAESAALGVPPAAGGGQRPSRTRP